MHRPLLSSRELEHFFRVILTALRIIIIFLSYWDMFSSVSVWLTSEFSVFCFICNKYFPRLSVMSDLQRVWTAPFIPGPDFE